MSQIPVYRKMDDLDVDKLTELAGNADWPKGKRCSVKCGKFELKAQTYLSKADGKIDVPFSASFDAYEALCRLRDELTDTEIDLRYYFDSTYPHEPRFMTKGLEPLNREQFEKRKKFIIAIANLLSDPKTMEAIIEAAPKKANGTFHKNRVMKIACSGLADYWNGVFAIVGRTKTDTTMSIVFEKYTCRVGDKELWENDFISTYRPGLPVSEALQSIL